MTTNPTCPECNTPVDEHPKGRCMDAWVHQKVYDKPVYTQDELAQRYESECASIIVTTIDRKIVNYDDIRISRVSSDIAAAMQALKKLETDGFRWSISFSEEMLYVGYPPVWAPGYRVVVRRMGVIEREEHIQIGTELPLAISRALIKAVDDD